MTAGSKEDPVSELEASCSSSVDGGCCANPWGSEDEEIGSTCRLIGLKNRQPVLREKEKEQRYDEAVKQ
jgi:hypothetical protein